MHWITHSLSSLRIPSLLCTSLLICSTFSVGYLGNDRTQVLIRSYTITYFILSYRSTVYSNGSHRSLKLESGLFKVLGPRYNSQRERPELGAWARPCATKPSLAFYRQYHQYDSREAFHSRAFPMVCFTLRHLHTMLQ